VTLMSLLEGKRFGEIDGAVALRMIFIGFTRVNATTCSFAQDRRLRITLRR
jgi:hypothetical protein